MHDLPAILVPALGTALLQVLWQGALVGALAWAALALLGNARPQASATPRTSAFDSR